MTLGHVTDAPQPVDLKSLNEVNDKRNISVNLGFILKLSATSSYFRGKLHP